MSEVRSRIGVVVFPGVNSLDFVAPLEVFRRVPSAEVVLVGTGRSSGELIECDNGFKFAPDGYIGDIRQAFDVVVVPGGFGVNEALSNQGLLDFLRQLSASAKYMTSVCTGALLLAAAGLLDGYTATTHWTALHLLEAFEVRTAKERVVVDRNRITAGGVTSGMDFGLRVVAELEGEATARRIALLLEYNPDPPYGGHPDSADSATVEEVRKFYEPIFAERMRTVKEIHQARLRQPRHEDVGREA